MSTNQFRRYLDLLNEADPELSNPTQPSSEPRCVVCGTPQSQHQALKHQFVAGGAADRPAPVAQGGSTGGGDVGRIKKLQAELKAAGAELGATGANRDGIDGDIGPLTTAAMAKYPNIAAKYADLSIAQAATPAVDTSKLNAALSAIESIVAKYKGKTKVSESRIYEVDRQLTPNEYQARIAQRIPPDLDAQETPGVRQSKIQGGSYVPPAEAPAPAASAAAQPSVYDRFNKPSGAPTAPAKAVELKPSGWASSVGKKILSKLPGMAARTAGAAAVSGPLAPFVSGAVLGLSVVQIGKMIYDAYKDSDNLEGINDADQAVIKQNLEVVNSFMKDPKVADSLPQDIKTRVENVYTDLIKLSVDTGYSTPAVTQQAATPTVTQQAATPATTPAAKANAAVPAVNTFVADLDKLLKKNNFESREYKTLSEQLARDRDIVNEGLGRVAYRAARRAGQDIYKGIGNNIIAPATTLATQAAMVGGIGYLAWDQLTKAIAPKAMSAADKAEFDRIIANYKKAVPDQATFDALPKPVQEKLIELAERLVQMEKAQPKGNK
jgi:hypothetical protein